MAALGTSLIVIGFALVCAGFIFWRAPDEQNGEVDHSSSPVEDSGIAEVLSRLNAMEPEIRDERGEDYRPGG